MRIVVLTRYPRVDTTAWKRRLGETLLGLGAHLTVLYTRSSTREQLRAGLGEMGLGVVSSYLSARARGGARSSSSPTSETPERLLSWADRRGVEVLMHERLDEGCLAALRQARPDLLVLAGSDIVPASVLEIPRVGTINGHYGLLPAYRGMNVTEWSVYHDDPVGVSVHFVDAGIDTGDILLRERIAVEPGDTLETLRPKHQSSAARLLGEAVRLLMAGEASAVPQAPSEGRQYYRMHPALRAIVEERLARGAYRWAATESRPDRQQG